MKSQRSRESQRSQKSNFVPLVRWVSEQEKGELEGNAAGGVTDARDENIAPI